MGVELILYWIYPLVLIPAVFLLSKEDGKTKFLGGILLAFIPWLVNMVSSGFISAIVTTLVLIGVIGLTYRKQADERYLLNDLSQKLIRFSNFLPKQQKKRKEVQVKASKLIKKNGGKPKKKYVLGLLVNAYGSQVGDKKKALKELGDL